MKMVVRVHEVQECVRSATVSQSSNSAAETGNHTTICLHSTIAILMSERHDDQLQVEPNFSSVPVLLTQDRTTRYVR